MYDVIVIGAGPAGSTAAKTLAEKGRRVLLVERRKVPRYKSCSGQLIQKTLDLVEAYYGEPVPESTMCTPTENRGVILTDDRGNTFRFVQSGRNVWRSAFDKWLADKAAETGAEVRDDTAALSCEEGIGFVAVTLKSGDRTCTEQARYIVDCEGVTGTLKWKLTGEKSQFITTYQTYNRGTIDLDHHYFYAWLQQDLSQYDAWFNVKDGQLVLGVSVRDSGCVNEYFTKFIAYMQKEHGLRIEKEMKKDRWIMHRVRPGCAVDHGVGRVFFAGGNGGLSQSHGGRRVLCYRERAPVGYGHSGSFWRTKGCPFCLCKSRGAPAGLYEAPVASGVGDVRRLSGHEAVREERMVILITGASHTGKTLLSQRMLERYGYPYLSMDHLKMGLIRSGQTDLTPEDDDEMTPYLWPIIREIMKTAIENQQNLIVEGCYVPFTWREDFSEDYLASIRFLCLAMTDAYIDAHFDAIVTHASDIESRLDDSHLTPAFLKAENRRYAEGFREAGEEVTWIEGKHSIPV